MQEIQYVCIYEDKPEAAELKEWVCPCLGTKNKFRGLPRASFSSVGWPQYYCNKISNLFVSCFRTHNNGCYSQSCFRTLNSNIVVLYYCALNMQCIFFISYARVYLFSRMKTNNAHHLGGVQLDERSSASLARVLQHSS